MVAISITITESPVQKLAGIPITILLTTNVAATIFFTLDDTDPDTSSAVVTGPISLPTDEQTVTLKAFATDGVTTCPIIERKFGSTTVPLRHPQDEVLNLNDVTKGATFPFGSQDQGGPAIYGNTARNINRTVDDEIIAGIPDMFDGTGTGTHTNETDLPLTEYTFIFTETNEVGERGNGLGTIPGDVVLEVQDPVQELSVGEGSSDANVALFNPKSLVIFQDGKEEPFDTNVTMLNRGNFSLEDPEVTRSGALYNTTAFEGNVTQGSSLVQRFNPRDNTITYYYFDSRVSRWIISKEPFSPKIPDIANFSKIVFGREKGPGRVFKWLPFHYRTLTI